MERPTRNAPISEVFVARQGVFDEARRVVGYELLLNTPTLHAGTSLDRAAARVMSDAVVVVGLDALTGSKRAFVTVSRHLLLEGLPSILPSDRVVVQLGTDIEADREVLAACDALKQGGYTLALDNFVLTPWTADLMARVSFVKMSVDDLDAESRTRILTAQAAGGPALVVKNVEATDIFQTMAAAGCRYFQGGFLERPILTSGRTVQAQQISSLRLLQALNNPNQSLDDIEELVKHDAALCFKILRTVNSAGFGLRTTVTSIRQALIMLGRDTIRRWASLWGLAGLNSRAHAELVSIATVRARFCEMLAEATGDVDLGSQAFLVGLCSLLDAILERPMGELLSGLPIASDLKTALLGGDNALRRLLDCAVAYERGRWQTAIDAAAALRLNPGRLPAAYEDAIGWSRELDRMRAAA